ncbi:MAG: hypothetical protein R3D33_09730 [Hyphomicrobiaceae bacterium]
MTRRFTRPAALAVLALLVLAAPLLATPAAAYSKRVLAALTEAQRKEVATVEKAKAAFRAALDSYWSTATRLRTERRARIKKGLALSSENFVTEQPPEYKGPELSKDLATLIDRLVAAEGGEKKPGPTDLEPREAIPGVDAFLAAAKKHYGFQPDLVEEAEFRRRYAIEALAVGLTREQIVRVFALETGGRGTFDMQSGINPVTRKGRPISTAIGYAQLLGANSIGEIGKRGADYVKRLEAMASTEGVDPQRAERLMRKAGILTRMVLDARSAGSTWPRHVAYARTGRGLGIHALNLDGDIGPWLQVNKLADLKETATRYGFENLTGGQLELMNLAGPSSGLEMMSAIAQDMPTANFFERGGYYRNPVVQKRTAAELLRTLDERIDVHMKKPDSIAFSAIFDELGSGGNGMTEAEAGAAATPVHKSREK